jgi:16S rRNA (cytidine1402-2'-O)-methyltransferase
VLPGPSAVQTALIASGLPPEPYAFVGFFPRRTAERRALLRCLAAFPGTVVGFESPGRLGALLAEVAAEEPDRTVAVCRELTKLHEEVVRGTAADLAERFRAAPRGEVTVVLAPPAERLPAGDEDLEPGLRLLLDAGLTPGRAAEAAAALGAAPRNRAYRAALAASGRRRPQAPCT